jgi:hypothetical protein
MKRTLAGIVAAAAVAGAALAQEPGGAGDVRRVAGLLAADAMRGRGAGSAELDRARDLVAAELRSAGLEPGFGAGWIQEFEGDGGVKLANVAGRVPGSSPEWLVVGAHYDGLGVGAPGTEHEGEVHPGADDNASGVAALVRIARSVAGATDFRRSLWIVAFSGEELGTLGSRHFVAHPPADLGGCVAMLNLDTVGRIENGRLLVLGSGTAEEFRAILQGANHAFGFDLAWNAAGVGASDHTPFLEKGIPSLHLFSGAKPEYHRPGDRLELLDFDATAKLADLVAEVAGYLAASEERLTFRPQGLERVTSAPGSSGPRRVSFGSIPDFSRESGGILLSGVMPGSPAEAAGLAAGDLLVELNGRALDTIHDFQEALAGHAPGDVVRVRYRRGEEEREAEVTLAERR